MDTRKPRSVNGLVPNNVSQSVPLLRETKACTPGLRHKTVSTDLPLAAVTGPKAQRPSRVALMSVVRPPPQLP